MIMVMYMMVNLKKVKKMVMENLFIKHHVYNINIYIYR